MVVDDEVPAHWFRWKGCPAIIPCTHLEGMGGGKCG